MEIVNRIKGGLNFMNLKNEKLNFKDESYHSDNYQQQLENSKLNNNRKARRNKANKHK